MTLWVVRLSGLLLLAGVIYLCTLTHAPKIESDLRDRAVSALKQHGMGWASVDIDGRDITLQGQPESAADFDQARELVAALPGVRRVEGSVVSAPATVDQPVEYSLVISRASPDAERQLTGYLPRGIDKAELLEAIGADSGPTDVEQLQSSDHLVKGSPEIFNVAAAALDELQSGSVMVGQDTIRISGKPRTAEAAATIRDRFGPFEGLGYQIEMGLGEMADSRPEDGGQREAAAAVSPQPAVALVTDIAPVQQCQQDIDTILQRNQILFANGKATLRAASSPVLDELAATVSACPEARLTIAGHTDSTGSAAANIRLSKRRAEAVKDYLVSRNIDPAIITTIGVGAAEPIADNNTAEGRALNRRIEMTLEGVTQ